MMKTMKTNNKDDDDHWDTYVEIVTEMENFQDETYPTTSIQLAIYRQANFFILVAKLTQLCYFMMLLNWELWQSLQVMIVPQRSPSPEEVDGTTRHDRKGEMFSLIAELWAL